METIRAMGNILFASKQDITKGVFEFGDQNILKIATMFNTLFDGKYGINLPRLIVVGAQSSGKSSLLNTLMKLNILSTGGEIVTRVPSIINMINIDSKQCVIEFYGKNGELLKSFELDPYNPNPNIETQVREYTIELTKQYAGDNKNVVDNPINIKLFSPLVPNLELLDLPGLTTLALTAKGQPQDICQQIEKMLTKYIKDEKSIVMSVIPCNRDPEIDAGLSLIKKLGKDKVIGVFTKPDTAGRGNNPGKYIDDNMVHDLNVKYGYYSVKNSGGQTDIIDDTNIADNQTEEEFFSKSPYFKNVKNVDRLGSLNLGKRLSEILIGSIREDLPIIFGKLRQLEDETKKELDGIGMDYPPDIEGKKMLINVLLNDFQEKFRESIKGRGSSYSTGNHLAKSYQQFKNDLVNLDPFGTGMLSDEVIRNMTCSYEGVHMPSPATPIEILELCISGKYTICTGGKKLDPIEMINEPFINCINRTQNIMSELIDTILNERRFSRFKNLVTKIKNVIVNSILPVEYNNVITMVNNYLESHRDYVWTDDRMFRESLNINEKIPNVVNTIRTILKTYYNVTKNQISEIVHRYIQVFYVNKVINEITRILYFNVREGASEDDLLKENDEMKKRHTELVSLITKIDQVKSTALKISS
jgi:GTP-binding protein EngB required for normal cell division